MKVLFNDKPINLIASKAMNIFFNKSKKNKLTATNVQDAIDEITDVTSSLNDTITNKNVINLTSTTGTILYNNCFNKNGLCNIAFVFTPSGNIAVDGIIAKDLPIEYKVSSLAVGTRFSISLSEVFKGYAYITTNGTINTKVALTSGSSYRIAGMYIEE